MTARRSKPADIVLDMLSSSGKRQRTVRSLISAGDLFGHSANTMRVTLSRLVAKGLIESPQRGLYRLTDKTDAMQQFVEGWRAGEARVRPWQPGDWLFAHTGSTLPCWALDALGFREVRTGLLARPDNLALPLDETRALALGIGMDAGTLLFPGRHDEAAAWRAAWNIDHLQTTYRKGAQRLRESAARLDQMEMDEARLECFALGGEMIHHLAKDPLLPEQWLDITARRELWQETLTYDAIGKDIWAAGKQDALRHMPHPQLTQELAS